MWGEEELELARITEDCEFDRATAREQFRLTLGDDPHLSARWARVTEEIEFVDVVEATHGRAQSNGFISCPFHGRDARPSFKLYRGSNDAWCFGCPYDSQHYDAVKFVKAKFGYTVHQAVTWLEKHFELPPMEFEDEEEDDDSEVEIVNLNFLDLAEPFIEQAAADFARTHDVELIRDYMAIYFAAVPARKADPNSEEELGKVTTLARALKSQAVEKIKKGMLR